MESTIRIEVDVDNKRFRVVDATAYTFSPSALAAKGLGTVRFNGSIVYQKLTIGDPLINLSAGSTTSAWVNATLDAEGNAAYGTYTVDDYSVRTAITSDLCEAVTAGSGGTGGFTLNGLNLSDVLEDGDSITITNSLSANNGVKTVASVTVASGNSTIFVDEAVNTETPVASSRVTFDITKQTASITAIYTGCTRITPAFSFEADCDYGLYGRLSVVDTTELNGQTLVSRLLTVKYPSWKDTADVTTDDGAIVLDALSTGTWTVINAYTITNVSGSIAVTYVASVSDERKVTCSGTLCGLLPCIQNLWNEHAAAVRTGFSPYQYFVDGILLNYTQAMEYKRCGNYDEYQVKVQAIEALLDASGCDCACCDDDVLIDVVNATADQASVIQDLQDQIDELVTDVTALQTAQATLATQQATQGSDIDTLQADVTDLQNLVIFTKMGVINQAGTAAPTYAASFESELSAMTFSRIAAGSFRITFPTAFDMSKVFPYVDTQNFTKGVCTYVESPTQIRILTYDIATMTLQDNVLLDSKIKIDFVQ